MTGSGIGGGLGGLLGTVLGAALAPETGGLSLAIPAGLGALGGVGGNLLGDLVTGETASPLGALESGVGGGVGGALAGAGGIGGLAAPASGAGGGTAAAAADPFGVEGIGEGVSSGTTDLLNSLPTDAITSAPAAEAPGLAPTSDLAITGAAAPAGGTASGSLTGDLASFGDTTTTAAGAVPAGGFPDVGALISSGGTGASVAAGGPGFANVGDLIASGQTGATTAAGGFAPDSSIPQDLLAFLKGNKDLLGPGVLGASYLKQALFPTAIPGSGTLSANSGLAQSIAQMLGTGGLTPAQQAESSTTLQQQITAIQGKFANLGLSGSDAEIAEIQAAQNANLGTSAGTETTNLQTALSAVGASDQPTIALANQQFQDDSDLQKMLAALAAASITASAKA